MVLELFPPISKSRHRFRYNISLFTGISEAFVLQIVINNIDEFAYDPRDEILDYIRWKDDLPWLLVPVNELRDVLDHSISYDRLTKMLNKLVEQGYLVRQRLGEHPMDKRWWYAKGPEYLQIVRFEDQIPSVS